MAVGTGTAILGAGALGALGSLGSKQGSTSSSSAPWEGQSPYLEMLFHRANKLYGQNGISREAQNLAIQRARDPNSIIGRTMSGIDDTVSGRYLSPETNPYFKDAVGDALGLAKGQIMSQFGGAAGQNVSNSGFQEHLARTLGSLATNAYADNYARERQNQLNAFNLVPSLGMLDANVLSGVDQDRWARLARFQQAVSGGNFGSTNQTPYFTNPISGALGGALSGGILAQMMSKGA